MFKGLWFTGGGFGTQRRGEGSGLNDSKFCVSFCVRGAGVCVCVCVCGDLTLQGVEVFGPLYIQYYCVVYLCIHVCMCIYIYIYTETLLVM